MRFLGKKREDRSSEVTEENKSQSAQENGKTGDENTVCNADSQKREEETGQKASEASGYRFAPDVKLKECRYCRVMIPKAAKICPNCKMRLKKRWLRNLLLLLLFTALILGGVYWYLYEYQGQMVSVMRTDNSAVPAEETQQQTAAETTQIDETGVTEQTTGTTGMTAAEEAVTEQPAKKPVEAGSREQAAEDSGDLDGLLGTLQLPEDTTGDRDAVKTDDGKLSAEPEAQEIIWPKVTEEDICGADGPVLDYADKDKVVFHDYYGLFVYDREAKEVSAAVDLEAIGCQYTQGDSACEVTVDEKGGNVYLHPVNADEMYVFAVEEQTLIKQSYTGEDPERIFEPKQTKDCVENDPTVFRSVSCAELSQETYLYLESGSGMALDLCYVVEQNAEAKERVYLLRDYGTQEYHTAETGRADNAEGVREKTVPDILTDGIAADGGAAEEMKTLADAEEVEPIDVSSYTEEEFRNLCQKVSYKALLRLQDTYLYTGVTVEVTVLEQVDGGLFDDNIYYLCVGQDADGRDRYYIIRDDREEDAMLILEGDVLRIYGQLFGNCKVPADLVASQPVVPALSMSYYELLDE